MDKTTLTLDPPLRACWMKVGAQKRVPERYPTGRIVLVMDNVSYYKSAAALAALSLFEHRVLVIWLPPYCSDLNPIERFWRYFMRKTAIPFLKTFDRLLIFKSSVLFTIS